MRIVFKSVSGKTYDENLNKGSTIATCCQLLSKKLNIPSTFIRIVNPASDQPSFYDDSTPLPTKDDYLVYIIIADHSTRHEKEFFPPSHKSKKFSKQKGDKKYPQDPSKPNQLENAIGVRPMPIKYRIPSNLLTTTKSTLKKRDFCHPIYHEYHSVIRKEPSDFNEKIDQLRQMGFDQDICKEALRACNYDIQRACDYIVSNRNQLNDHRHFDYMHLPFEMRLRLARHHLPDDIPPELLPRFAREMRLHDEYGSQLESESESDSDSEDDEENDIDFLDEDIEEYLYAIMHLSHGPQIIREEQTILSMLKMINRHFDELKMSDHWPIFGYRLEQILFEIDHLALRHFEDELIHPHRMRRVIQQLLEKIEEDAEGDHPYRMMLRPLRPREHKFSKKEKKQEKKTIEEDKDKDHTLNPISDTPDNSAHDTYKKKKHDLHSHRFSSSTNSDSSSTDHDLDSCSINLDSSFYSNESSELEPYEPDHPAQRKEKNRQDSNIKTSNNPTNEIHQHNQGESQQDEQLTTDPRRKKSRQPSFIHQRPHSEKSPNKFDKTRRRFSDDLDNPHPLTPTKQLAQPLPKDQNITPKGKPNTKNHSKSPSNKTPPPKQRNRNKKETQFHQSPPSAEKETPLTVNRPPPPNDTSYESPKQIPCQPVALVANIQPTLDPPLPPNAPSPNRWETKHPKLVAKQSKGPQYQPPPPPSLNNSPHPNRRDENRMSDAEFLRRFSIEKNLPFSILADAFQQCNRNRQTLQEFFS